MAGNEDASGALHDGTIVSAPSLPPALTDVAHRQPVRYRPVAPDPQNVGMQVGLVRHFKIPYRKWQWLDSDGYATFLRWYDDQEGHERESTHPHIRWQHCYSSDILRARATAERLGGVTPTTLSMLREIPQAPMFSTRLKMPLIVWHVLSRIGWWCNHSSQAEGRKASLARVQRIIEWLRTLPEGQSSLVVTHGYLMYVLRRELKRAGWAGHIPLHPQGGEIYLWAMTRSRAERASAFRDSAITGTGATRT